MNNAIAKVMRNPVAYMKRRENQAQHQHSKQQQQLMGHEQSKKKQSKAKAKAKPREFNMTNYASRSVAVKLLYDGENLAGFARQDHMPETVERHLFDALVRTKLIADIDSSGYSRCGRTDRGVSAFGQVIGLRVRSNLPANAELLDVDSIDAVRAGEKFRVKLPSGEIKTLTEIDYPTHINRSLPPEIRVYSVVTCAPEFCARFDCQWRVYRYFFVKKQLDIDRMRAAANKLVGPHDFRNFCRIDPNCHTFEREIRSFEIAECGDHIAGDPSHQLYRFEVMGDGGWRGGEQRRLTNVWWVSGGRSAAARSCGTRCGAWWGSCSWWARARSGPRWSTSCSTSRRRRASRSTTWRPTSRSCCTTACSPTSPSSSSPSPPQPMLSTKVSNANLSFFAASYSPLALMQVQAQLQETWERHSIRAAMTRSHLDMLENFSVASADVIRELDHYSPKLEQLLKERGDIDCDLAWKDVMPLLPLASKRKILPLLTRDTADSVSERKQKFEDRKRRREEVLQPSDAATQDS